MKPATTSFISVAQSTASKLPTKQSLHATEIATVHDIRLHHEQLEFKFMAEIQKLSAKQLIRATEIATAQDTRLQKLQDRAAGDDPDVAEIAEADIFRGFGDRDNGE